MSSPSTCAGRRCGGSRFASESGFTLIELMIVLVFAAILVALAMPAYRGYVRDGQRTEAQAVLSDAAARLNRYFFDNNGYTTDLSQVGYNNSTLTSPSGTWTIAAAAGSTGAIATSFILTATSVDATRDPECTSLTLSSQGQKGFTGTAGDLDTCW